MDRFDEDAFREDIAWRFERMHGAACRRTHRSGTPDTRLGNDGLRFWWSLTAGRQGERTGMAFTLHTLLLEPWRQTSAAVNRLHSRLHLSPQDMLGVSTRAAARCGTEALEWAQIYGSLQRDLAGPAVHLCRRLESIRLDACALAETQYMRSGWHTSAAQLWLQLQHLAGCVYPLLPSFGTALWRALHGAGAPSWPEMPGGWAVRPVPLHAILLEAPPLGECVPARASVAGVDRRLHGEHLVI